MPVTAEYAQDAGRWVVHATAGEHDDATIEHDLADQLGRMAAQGAGQVQLWIHDVSEAADAFAHSLGAVAYRDLWQLRCPLPAAASGMPTRAFTVADIDAVIEVNNRAFAWHPEQSGLTHARFAQTMAEPWFDPDGVRLFERDGHLVGFCWTKLHHDLDPVLGEIYVIAVDPSAHGQGLGAPMTLAGLEWISARGITGALLYVESDNAAANRTYEKIGFTHHRTDRAYNLTVSTRPSSGG